MTSIAKESKERRPLPERRPGASTQPSVLETLSPKQVEVKSQSPSLSVCVSQQLLKLMNEVTSQDINPRTVNAAVNCANAIHKFITLNLKMRP